MGTLGPIMSTRSNAAPTDNLPVPHDGEEKGDYLDRYAKDPFVKQRFPGSSIFKRRHQGEIAWGAAKLRSRVSIKNSEGEWLLFD